jgi:hypothetical protein
MSKCTSWWLQGEDVFFTYPTQDEAKKVCEWISSCTVNRYDTRPVVVETPAARCIGNDRYAVRVKIYGALDYFRNNVID